MADDLWGNNYSYAGKGTNLETPRSLSVLTRDQVDEQGATSVPTRCATSRRLRRWIRHPEPAHRFVSGSRFRRTRFGKLQGNYIDGLRWYYGGRQATQIDPWMTERIEVLKGLASIL